jgi:hypothetical protein
MDSIFTKIVLGAIVLAVFFGFVPGNGARGWIFGIGILVVAAFVLHFVAP